MASRLDVAKQDIVETFARLPPVMHVHDVVTAFEQNRERWRLAVRTSFTDFVEFLLSRTPLRRVSFEFKKPASGYVWGEMPLLQALMGLVDNSYLSHYSAVRIHGLTEQFPATVYLTQPRTAGRGGGHDELKFIEQAAIDAAFQRPPRESSDVVQKGDTRIVLLHGSQHGDPGIVSGSLNYDGTGSIKLRYSSLERTLVDIAVRPAYAGGVFEVAKAYESAVGRGALSINTMSSILKRMDLIYPYHQAVGFYLERAGVKKALLVDLFKSQPMERDFYLTHQMGRTRYVAEWRLHVPEGF